MALTQPALSFNFLVTMWDCQGPGFFGVDGADAGGWGIASRIAGGLVNVASQFFVGAFAEVGGLNLSLQLETYSAGGENAAPKNFVKSGGASNLTFKRGITFNTDLWDWHQQVLHGSDPMIRKSGTILLLERASLSPTTGRGVGSDLLAQLSRPPIAAWSFERGLPVALTGPTLDAKTSAVAMEQLDISHEGLTRVSLAALPGVSDAAASVGGLLSAVASGIVVAAGQAGQSNVRESGDLRAGAHYDVLHAATLASDPLGGG